MMPKLSPRDKILVSTLPYLFSKPKTGDIVVFRFEEKIMIKKIENIENGKYLVRGENESDSLKIPKLERKEILGKVIFKI